MTQPDKLTQAQLGQIANLTRIRSRPHFRRRRVRWPAVFWAAVGLVLAFLAGVVVGGAG